MTERPEQERIRFEKLLKLRGEGFSYPNDVNVTAHAIDILKRDLTDNESPVTIAGRIVQHRVMGKATFCQVLDGTGKIQIYAKKDDLGEKAYELVKDLDLGDIIEAKGKPFITKTGEKTIHCDSVRLLTKSLVPLPEKWHGLSDIEARYRYRYLDLIANPDVREVFRRRSKIIQGVRSFLTRNGFLEVETPVLHYVPAGATARPFKTHHNTLGTDMYLRVALELPLKKLTVGGIERVFEIGKNFRNEGVSKKHNPEFTMLEFYQAYATFHSLMALTEEMITEIALDVCGTLKIPAGEKTIDLTPPWPRISMLESVYKFGGVSRDIDLSTLEGAKKAAKDHNVVLSDRTDWGRCLEDLWGTLVEHHLINPTFITHHPFSISPLARRSDDNPQVTDRFELVVNGMELANAFSELNDAVDQRERFEDQARRKASGDEEAHDVEEDFLRAIEVGLPPTGGEGIGIDRLVMLLTDSHSIRDVVFFPQLKPLEHE